jgi:large subunit ribosomal protein L10
MAETQEIKVEEKPAKAPKKKEVKKPKAHVSEIKKKTVAELTDLIKKSKTILFASVSNLPGSQFQEICKKLRGKAVVKVPKKNLMFRAIDEAGNAEVKKLEEKFDNAVAVLFSDLDAFELAGDLLQSKSPAKAKPGQEAPEDIEIKAGPTDLVPGPAISELGAVGLQVQVTDGKLHIKQDKVIVKAGEPIKQEAADIMAKLDIKPFSIGFIPLAAFDTKENKFYAEINIDPEGTLEDLKEAFGRALPFAVEIGYTSPDTIKFFLSKANAQAGKINRIMTGEPEPEVVVAPADAGVPPSEDEGKKKKEEPKEASGAGLGALFG